MNKKHRNTPFIRPSVVFDPNLADGIDVIADAIKSTLGPLPRLVGVERIERGQTPELLDDAGAIARRIIQIADPTADAGAMLLRHGMWRMRERMGDGSATMAVLTQAMLKHAKKGVAAGMHPMTLRRGIEIGVQIAVDELRRDMRPVPAGKPGYELLTKLAHSLSADRELMDAVATIVNTLGPEGAVDLVINERRSVDYEFIEGAVWNSGWLGAAYTTDSGKTIARQEDVAVLLLECDIETQRQAVLGIQRLVELGVTRAAILAPRIADEALQVFTSAHLQGVVTFVLAKSPFVQEDRMTALHDIAALTGARILYDIGEFMHVTPSDLGFARRLWATSIKLGIISGKRQGNVLRGRIAAVREAIAGFTDKKHWDQLKKLRLRLAQMTGGFATLLVGGMTKSLAETRKEQAERIIHVLQGVVGSGLVAGGGAALLACARVVEQQARQEADVDLQYGIRCVGQALGAPMAIIAHNAGYESSEVLARVRHETEGHGFDVRSGQVVDMWQSGIMDSFVVIERALQTAASVAIMSLTTTCVVHHRKFYAGLPTP